MKTTVSNTTKVIDNYMNDSGWKAELVEKQERFGTFHYLYINGHQGPMITPEEFTKKKKEWANS